MAFIAAKYTMKVILIIYCLIGVGGYDFAMAWFVAFNTSVREIANTRRVSKSLGFLALDY